MADKKDKIVKVLELRAMGKSMEEIGREMGITRQTVSTYLRTPEAQAIAQELQTSLLETLQKSLACVNLAIEKGDVKTAREIAVNLGKITLAQVPRGTESRDKMTPEERRLKIESARRALLEEPSE